MTEALLAPRYTKSLPTELLEDGMGITDDAKGALDQVEALKDKLPSGD